MKVKVVKTHPSIEDAFPLGSEVTVEKVLYEEDTQISQGTYIVDRVTKERIQINPPTIAPKGSYKSCFLINHEGVRYPGDMFTRAMGPNNGRFDKVFEKI